MSICSIVSICFIQILIYTDSKGPKRGVGQEGDDREAPRSASEAERAGEGDRGPPFPNLATCCLILATFNLFSAVSGPLFGIYKIVKMNLKKLAKKRQLNSAKFGESFSITQSVISSYTHCNLLLLVEF